METESDLESSRATERTFSTQEAAALLNLSTSEVRAFARAGLEAPKRGGRGEYRFGFRDLVVLRMAADLRHAAVPANRVAGVLADLRNESGSELAGLKLEALGAHIVVRDGEVVWRADSGQLHLPLGPSAVPDPAPRTLPGADGVEAEGLDADGWLEEAIAAEGHDPDRAIRAYGRALEVDPARWEALTGLAFLLQEIGRPGEAIPRYREALALEPDATVAFNLGVALEESGRTEEAESAYLEALSLDPALADAHFNLSGLYETRGDRAEALHHMIAYRERRER